MSEPPFDSPRSHREDPHTSHYAADTNTTSETHQRMILRAHLNAGVEYAGYTDEEVGRETGLETVEARRRCNNLRNAGYLAFNGQTRPGIQFPTKPNQVSIITDAGRAVMGRGPAPTPVGQMIQDMLERYRRRQQGG